MKSTPSNVTTPRAGAAGVGSTGSAIDGVRCSTSVTRRAQTIARGSIIAMNAPIMTAARICSRYCRKAVSEPTCTSPWSTRIPPNHITAPVATFRISMITGNISTKRLPIFSDNPVRSVFAASKRRVSCSSRVKARTTRTPVICSRKMPLIRSILPCRA